MAKGAYIRVSGLKELQKKIREIPKHLTDGVDAVMGAAANDYANRAIADAPRDQGFLIQQIQFNQKKVMYWEVTSGAEWSAYIEWGTRSRVQVPAELTSYASQFKGGQKGGNPKQKIYDWCKREGIPEEAWYPIFISIMTKGIHPHPFFFIQKAPIEKQLTIDLKDVVKQVLNR